MALSSNCLGIKVNGFLTWMQKENGQEYVLEKVLQVNLPAFLGSKPLLL